MIDMQSCSFVVVGKFNPAIISPAWLGFNKLVQPNEAIEASIDVVSQQISSYVVDWLRIQVTQDRFLASTGESSKLIPLRDLFFGIFHLLSQTPVSALGINFSHIFETETEDDWHRIGHTLAPKLIWNNFIEDAGMVEATIGGKIPEITDDRIRVTVKPTGPKGVVVVFNHHFEIPKYEEGNFRDAHRYIEKTIESNWKKIIEFNEKVTQAITKI